MTVLPATATPSLTREPCLAATSVASWLLMVDRTRQRAVRGALAALVGVDYRTTVGDHLVIVSESPPRDVDRIQQTLRAIPDVRDVALVSVFEDGPSSSS